MQIAGRLFPVEPLRGGQVRAVPQDPGREHAVEEGLHQGGLEELLALGVRHFEAEGVFEGLADGLHRPVGGGVLDPAAGVPGVAGQEPGDVLRVGQRGRPAEAAFQEIEQPVAVLGHGALSYAAAARIPFRWRRGDRTRGARAGRGRRGR